MLRSLVKNGWFGLAPLLLLPGCLVSFNDYPLGDIEGTSGGVSAKGGAGAGGSLPLAGTMMGMAGAPPDGDGGAMSIAPNKSATMIDDFEDADPQILAQQGRSGSWYVVNDETPGMQTPGAKDPFLPSSFEPARGNSMRALHTFGGGFMNWGALVGTSLASQANEGLPYDVTAFQGLHFWVRSGSTPGAEGMVRLNLPTPDTDDRAICGMKCSDHFGVDVPLASQWVEKRVRFSDLKQVGYGMPMPAAPDLVHVLSVQFAFGKDATFDLWVDDLELY